MNLTGADRSELPQHTDEVVLTSGEAGVGRHRVDDSGGDPIHVVPQVPMDLVAGVLRRTECEPERCGQVRFRFARFGPRDASHVEQCILFRDIEIQCDAGEAVSPRRGAAQCLGPDGADQQSRATGVLRWRSDRDD